MSIIEITLLAIALAMDCFAVSIASGIILKQLKWSTYLTMAFSFGLFQGGMPLIGWALTRWASDFSEAWDHWIAFSLLVILGTKMIYEHFTKNDKEKAFSPTRLIVIITLSIATSIDAFAVGISFACLGITHLRNIIIPTTIIGLVSFIFSLCGSILGVTLGKRIKLHAELFGGILLIAIGFKILIEHLVTGL
jgi:putative Mn2+ efflux pump MntP